MSKAALSDRFTLIAVAIIAYSLANISHEVLGHCGTALFLGTKCSFISTTDIRLTPEISAWKFGIESFAGSGANWLVAFLSLGISRGWRSRSPGLRYFLWLSLCVNLFLPSTYLLISPIIMFGDWYKITVGLNHQLAWRCAMTTAGAVACWLSFRLCRDELSKLIGMAGTSARSIAWQLVVPAYFAGGIVAGAAALFSPLPSKWAQFVAVGGTFGVTFWLLLIPLRITESPVAREHHFIVGRSIGWIIAGALTALIFVGVLGPGFHT